MPTEIILPKVDMVMETGTFIEWLKKDGEQVEKGEALFIIMTDKSAIECESPASGILAGMTAEPDDVIPVTHVIGYILASGESLPQPKEDPAPQPSPQEKTVSIVAAAEAIESSAALTEGQVRATPLARSLAREKGLDLSQIAGRGPRGRIHKADVLAAAEPQKNRQIGSPLSPQSGTFGELTEMIFPMPEARERQRIPLKGARAIIAQRMSYSASVIPHIYETIIVDVGEMARLREKSAASIHAATGHKLTYTAILAYVVSRVLPRHPYLNSSLLSDEIVLWEDVNLGLATDLGEYLIVPVIKEAQNRDLRGIAEEIGRMVEAARSKKLTPAEMKNGTFTISNLGMYGIESFTTIINPPEAAILGVGSISENSIPGDTQGNVRRTMKLVLGADHRIVDGGKAARFLVDLKSSIENPYLLF